MKRPRYFAAWAIQVRLSFISIAIFEPHFSPTGYRVALISRQLIEELLLQVACLLVLLQSCTNWTNATPLRRRRQSAFFAAQSRQLSNNFRERRVQNAVPSSSATLDVDSVPIIQIPLTSQPAAHHTFDAAAALTSRAQRFPDAAGVSDDELLSYFPADVLKSTAKFRPVKVRVIEHDDYIDYELAFVEEEEDGAAAAATHENGKGSVADTVSPLSSTERPTELQITAPSFTAVTFVNLLERARRRHHELMAAATAAAPIQSTTTPMTPPAATTPKPRGRVRTSRVPLRSNFFRIKQSYEQNTAATTGTYESASRPRQHRIPRRDHRASGAIASGVGSVALTPLQSNPHRQPKKSPLLAQTSTQRPQSKSFTNVQTVSEMVVTRNVSSTRIVANREAHVSTPSTISPEIPAAVPHSLPLPEHEKLNNDLSTTEREAVFETTFTTPITTTTTKTILSTALSTISPTKTTSIPIQATTPTSTATENLLDQEVLESRPSNGAKNRIPRIIEPSKWEENAAAQVLSGEACTYVCSCKTMMFAYVKL